LDHGAELILFAAEHLLELEFLNLRQRLGVFAVEFLFAYFAGFVEFVQHFEVVKRLAYLLESVSPHLLRAQFAKHSFCLAWILPKICLLGDSFFVAYFYNLTIVVKDTSSRRKREPSNLSVVLLSWFLKSAANIRVYVFMCLCVYVGNDNVLALSVN